MRRALFSTAVLAVLAAGCSNSGGPRQPWIQDATSDSVTIAWEAANAGGTQKLVWGPTTPLGNVVNGTLVSDKLYEAKVTGLPASTSYQYFVQYDGQDSPMGTFTTAPTGAEPFRFAVNGDNRSDSAGHASVVQATLPFAPDFVLNTGDISDMTNYTDFFNVEQDLLRNSVIFPAPGNHDVASLYQYGFDRPDHYAFRWGNAFFVSISTDADYSVGSSQYTWVQQQLAAAKADATVKWIVACHHYPVYSSGTTHGSTQAVIDSLNGLYKQYAVDLVFTGHEHNYERVEKDGIVYVVSGGGGVGTYPLGSPVSGHQYGESTRHVVIIDVDGGSLDLKAYRPDGTLMDSRHLQKP